MKVHLKEQSFFTRKKTPGIGRTLLLHNIPTLPPTSLSPSFFLTKNLITTLQKRRLLRDIPSPFFCLTMPLGATTERACWPVLSTPGTISEKRPARNKPILLLQDGDSWRTEKSGVLLVWIKNPGFWPGGAWRGTKWAESDPWGAKWANPGGSGRRRAAEELQPRHR